jgi:hypothetical protein
MWAIVGLKIFGGDVSVKDAKDTSNDPSNDQKDSPMESLKYHLINPLNRLPATVITLTITLNLITIMNP